MAVNKEARSPGDQIIQSPDFHVIRQRQSWPILENCAHELSQTLAQRANTNRVLDTYGFQMPNNLLTSINCPR